MLAILVVGDDAAQEFDELVDKYERRVFNLILRIVGDYDEAADLTQDTFLAAYRAFDRFRGQAKPYTWLYRIAINVCKNRFREKKKQQEIELESGNDAATTADTMTPEKVVQQKELKDLIENAILRLQEDYRIVIVLREMHGLTYREIAEAMDISEDVVKTRLARARNMLRQKLAPYLNQEK
jgi:RNA polymerase sigma-70 factor (ECF subfamily)